MKRVIFSLHIDIPKQNLETHQHNRSQETKDVFNQYKDQIIKNHKDYCKSINCDYKLFTEGPDNYVDVNHYKHELMYNLSKEYDEVVYVDFDVIVNTTKNIFEKLDFDKVNVKCSYPNINRFLNTYDNRELHRRSHINKYYITHSLLSNEFLNPEMPVMNTGIIATKSSNIQKINFPGELKEVKEKIDLYSKEDFMVPEGIHWEYNNESIFAYLISKKEIPYNDITGYWHNVLSNEETENDIKEGLNHFINKQLTWYFD